MSKDNSEKKVKTPSCDQKKGTNSSCVRVELFDIHMYVIIYQRRKEHIELITCLKTVKLSFLINTSNSICFEKTKGPINTNIFTSMHIHKTDALAFTLPP